MPGPLLVIDAPSLMYRAFHALPKSITGPDGTSVNALLGTANLVVQAVEKHDPRAVVFAFGAEAADYRVELYEPYHADRPEMPAELQPQWADARAFFEAFGWTVLSVDDLEADDLLGSLATIETAAGRNPAARSALGDAVRLQPDNPDSWLRLAEFELNTLQRPKVALSAIRPALYLDPRSSDAVAVFLAAQRQTTAP
jgi:DNA polymerase-1